jgi:hypothetical protein
MLEALCHPVSSFITLTYRPDEYPVDGSLQPNHTKNWLKRLRRRMEPDTIRYFLVGEYGEKTERAHYHAALFGYPPCLSGNMGGRRGCNCSSCTGISETWGKGNVFVGSLTPDSAGYIAGYVTKKMTNGKNEKVQEFLKGRHPEYARMSLKPGIGAPAVDKIVEMLETDLGCSIIENEGDVPSVLSHGKKKYPLGRYLRRKIREKMGWKNTGTPEDLLSQLREENIEKYFTLKEKTKLKIYDQKALLLEENRTRIKTIEKRQKIFESKRSI